jgi:hypothetical protein
MNPDMWTDELAFSWRHELLRQHLKTGYFDDIYLLLEKYKRITPIPSQYRFEPTPKPPAGPIGPYRELPPSDIIKHGVTVWSKRENKPEKPEQKEDEKILIAREKLRKAIAEKLSALMYRVEHGIPLEGECDCCPHLHITIKD